MNDLRDAHLASPAVLRDYTQKVTSSTLVGSKFSMGRWQSGQLHQTVNLTPHGYAGSNPALPNLIFKFGKVVLLVPIVQLDRATAF